MTNPLAKMLLVAGLSACAIAPAYASTGMMTRTVVKSSAVKTSDLDLNTPAGERQLRDRVASAVRHVCRVTDSKTGFRVINRDVRACMAKARANADRQVAALLNDDQRGG